MMPAARVSTALGLCLLAAGIGGGPPASAQQADLTELSLEQLLDIQVTSVSKKTERREQAPAAIYVITREDIRRSGATTIPELLRMVPGMNVARIDASKWAVTSRGFNERYSNKLLFLIDGRSAYSPHAAAVYWESQDVPLEDVERIEVIRGPGGALWGANAVNGVINVITKRSQDTQGGLLSVGGGTEERGFAALRYGGRIGEDKAYRLWAKYVNRDNATSRRLDEGNDAWEMVNGGFRYDWTPTEQDAVTLQFDAFGNSIGERFSLPLAVFPNRVWVNTRSHYTGLNTIATWTRTFSEASELQVRAYYERWNTRVIFEDETRETWDLDLQHRLRLSDRHELVFGAGFRYTRDSAVGTQFVSLDPDERRYRIFSAFVQDEITLVPDRFTLILGTKIEHNDYTGFEFQPNARAVWTPNPRHTIWAAVSRAVRTPSRAEDDVRVAYLGLPGFMASLFGTRDSDAEELLAFEFGYRLAPTRTFALDVAFFYNRYSDLRTIELGVPFFEMGVIVPHIALPFYTRNNMDATTYGAEWVLDYRPRPWWNMRLAYSFLEIDLDKHYRSIDVISGLAKGDTPEQQVYFSNRLDLPGNVEFDVNLRYVDGLPKLNVDPYLTADARLAWKPRDNLEVAVVGQNLFDAHHYEFRPYLVPYVPTRVDRGIYGKLTWTF